MPEATAARRFTRRQLNGGRHAAASAWRAWMRAGIGAALALAVALGGLTMPVAEAAGAAANTENAAFPPGSLASSDGGGLPGFHSPPPTSSYASGTTAGGPVRTRPAQMPFYVATRGTTTIYVLGTLHVGDPADYPPGQPFRRPILAALDASPILALELSPDDLLVSQDDVSKYGVCRRPCLQQALPGPLWQRLVARMRGNPEALAEIRQMRPWLASLMVETYDSLSAGLQTEYGTEAQLQNVFLKLKGRRIVGLETLAEQMRAFTNLTLAQQREMLAQDLAQTPAQNVADVEALLRLWRLGDADAIAAWEAARSERLAQNLRVSESIDDRILYRRNRRFVSRMVAIAAPNRPVFVAIGALHLGGRRGVLALLGERGFVVVPG
ncbi:TraB/GumN family protein [Burkholderia sp. WAC0059]|uniref:TraB/GumN family protein n=1 Tax=Burkholderia sp. WAC0059 TaxID=2066022 RepID=UPI000C7F41B4|nr:TraB/GumN family protein [Burkholderia sp. WAC0059]PLZ00695.1 TraB/GumN family protein [Burkholderia sp. WAC0059]